MINIAFSFLLIFIGTIFQNSSCGFLRKMTVYLLLACVQKVLVPGYPDVVIVCLFACLVFFFLLQLGHDS